MKTILGVVAALAVSVCFFAQGNQCVSSKNRPVVYLEPLPEDSMPIFEADSLYTSPSTLPQP